MKKTIKRSGFTIVELVIVIAVIAVLAGVLIPTFGGIIERANESNDNQVVATVNKLLVVDNIIKGDDPNDAVEIKKMLKDNGVSLKTKSEGKYIWYDIDQNKVILAGLDANGIVFLNDNDKDPKASATKGKFKEATAPELFIDGYVFLSDESEDGLAEAIYDLRNPVDASSITKALGEIAEMNPTLGEKLSSLMDRTVVLTKDNDAVFVGSNKDVVTKVIVSSEKTTLFKKDITSMSAYKNIIVVDLHSGVVEIENTAENNALNEIKVGTKFFVYDNDDIKTKYDTNPDIDRLVPKEDRPKYIGSLNLVFIEQGKDEPIYSKPVDGLDFEIGKFVLPYEFPYQYFGTATEAYDFVSYSLFKNGSNTITTGTNGYTLKDEEQYLIYGGVLNLYVTVVPANEDFKINNTMYSSTAVTHMLANDKLPSGTTNITVVSTGATLNETNKTLKLPAGVTLYIPYSMSEGYNFGTNQPNYLYGDSSSNTGVSAKLNYYNSADRDGENGVYKLTVADNTKLDVYGRVIVDAKLYGYSNTYFGFIADDISVLQVNSGAKINLKSGAGFNAFGIVKGDGEVIAESGSSVVEPLTVLDLNGGTFTSFCVLNNKTPFNRFRAESIRLSLKVCAGAEYTSVGFVTVNDGNQAVSLKIAGIPSTANNKDDRMKANPVFNIDSGDIVKTFDDNTGMHLTINGTVTDCAKKTEVMGYGVDFTKVPLPLGDFDVTVATGANLTLSNCIYKILPGSDWVVNGTLNVNTTVAVYENFEISNVRQFEEWWQTKTETCNTSPVGPREYEGAFTSSKATFTVSGTLDLKSNARFGGKIQGTSGTIKISNSNNGSCDVILEGSHRRGWKDLELCTHQVNGMITQAQLQTGVNTYTNLPTTAGQYTFKGNDTGWTIG
ncbi:MAG: type II secretion system protein [Clostridia bacterium]|nr:type II secretion system protein [Clostridia bacterium]